MTYGYARVSTREQKEDRQLIALEEAGVRRPALYIDKQSGKDFKRPEYQKMLQRLKKDDLLCIKSIDRLGRSYGETVREIEELTGKTYDKIHVVGGGSNADYLNELTARYTKKEVLAGPGEATAIGNVAVQMIAAGELKDIWDARSTIRNSFEIRSFQA